nr:MAG TPA: hypothetical protein [Caudoviricetes sp.]
MGGYNGERHIHLERAKQWRQDSASPMMHKAMAPRRKIFKRSQQPNTQRPA